MYQFFVEENQLTGTSISILGNDVNHISPRARAWFAPEHNIPVTCPVLRG